MVERKLKGINPENVFKYFEDICSIPHGSGNTKLISDYLVKFAIEHNLKYIQDEINNVIIFANGTKGYENHVPIILQGHMDMVCEKDNSSNIDMEKDGLEINHNDEFVFANGTTLGGDDGIAVAFILAILDDNTISHPPIEAIITVDEETGMDGAVFIDLSPIKSKTLINIDSEDEGIFTISCAGGAKSTIHIPLEFEKASGNKYVISIDGLSGGHSGTEIHKNRCNAIKLMGEILLNISENSDLKIIELNGGAKDNAIPRSCYATIISNINNIEEICSKIQDITKNQYDEPFINITAQNCQVYNDVALTKNCTNKIIDILNIVPNGLIKWSDNIENLVETSLNLGVAKQEDKEIKLTFAVRSSVNEDKKNLIEKLKEISREYNCIYTQKGEYPAWEYTDNSKIRTTFIDAYKKLYKKEPKIEAIHAGLECGLLKEKIEGLDCISFGPQMHDIHTSREKLDIKSTERTFNLLKEVLKNL